MRPLVALIGVLAVAGCGSEPGRPTPLELDSDGAVPVARSESNDAGSALEAATDDGAADAGTCTDRTERDCVIKLATHGNVENCFQGVQDCVKGHWGVCHSPDQKFADGDGGGSDLGDAGAD